MENLLLILLEEILCEKKLRLEQFIEPSFAVRPVSVSFYYATDTNNEIDTLNGIFFVLFYF